MNREDIQASTTIAITTSSPHGLEPGMIVDIDLGESRLKRLWNLIRRPRLHVVTSAADNSMRLTTRRMSWSEWRSAIWRDVLRP